MNWTFLENVLSGVNKYSTVIGRIWLSVVFLFRILVYVAAAEQVWKDEQRDFVCNTEQPGCENACFDHFFPISQVRLWALQLIMVSTPSLLVALHVAYREHRETKHKRRLYRDKGSIDGGLFCTYTVSLVFKIALEVGSLLAFYFLYNGFEVPILLRCSQSPCPNTVDCYTARAKEKKIFLYIMGCTSILCVALNVVELMYITWKQLWKCFTRRYIPVEESALSHSRPPVSIVNKFVSAEPTANTEDSSTQPTRENQPVQSSCSVSQ
ncbi:gap junction beta-7 protein-like [Seriola lalandi dorsalis]|uniref:gap junction beta-7 protein-like n=1 Tax=Seriola lalandi dorsalis TaxID=1841481 RepID=UPI000C6F6980|nr:gap junction beta-7 protein-like [Seriola lalandi dorsalis]